MFNYTIYQIANIGTCDYAFREYRESSAARFNINDYVSVYEGSASGWDKSRVLEDLFVKFNTNHPHDFKGHSLSVSDVIELTDDQGETSYHYCNTFGWKDVTDQVMQVCQ